MDTSWTPVDFENPQRSSAPWRYVCIHGHFYQPPRENPWLETVETQDSAAPYHDWNERITAECYAPNGASRIVNEKNRIIQILNNYGHISFNFGPTLLSWLEENAPRAYRMVLDADQRSRRRFGGHGSAMAQVYNHIIMPLANTRDRITQIRWGIADFESRYGRKPEGMWLAETAVDTETLELLAEHGILFTVLAPSQCAAVRPLGEQATSLADAAWQPTPNATVDTTQPYLARLKTGRSIALFFYDGPRSRAIAFEGLLNSGENFANRLAGGFDDSRKRAQLVHVATDGESYGHHHKHGEMALSYALQFIEQKRLARVTNYGEFLAKFPPTREAQIAEATSWSCVHGVERWRSDCGCNSGHQGWNQRWRGPLRAALDWLRDSVQPLSEQAAQGLLKELWAPRDAYISVVLDRSRESVDRFLAAHATHELTQEERTRVLKLMELQRHALLMYTSCGWFFDEISGIETVQVIEYAGRVLQLAQELFGPDKAALETEFIERLSKAESNVPEEKDGGHIYQTSVKTAQVDLEQVAAHYAISSVFGSYPERTRLFCYTIRRKDYTALSSGGGRLVLGQATVSSHISEETEDVDFAVLHFGDQNINAAVKRHIDAEAGAYAAFKDSVISAITRADFPEVIRRFDRYFGGTAYSLTSLFTDEQRRILQIILNTTLSELESSLSIIYEDHASLLHFLSQAGLPKPPALTMAAGFSINSGLKKILEDGAVDAERVRSLVELAKNDQIELDRQVLSYLADQRMKRAMVELQWGIDNPDTLENALATAGMLGELPFELSLWQAQNIWYETLRMVRRKPGTLEQAGGEQWLERFHELGKGLSIDVNLLTVEEESLTASTEAVSSPKLSA